MQIDKDTSVIESRFQEHFKLHFNSNESKFRSIAFCYLNRVSVLGHEDHNAISIIAITKPQSYEYPITIALYMDLQIAQLPVFYINWFILLMQE